MLCVDSRPVWGGTPLSINQELDLILALHSTLAQARSSMSGVWGKSHTLLQVRASAD